MLLDTRHIVKRFLSESTDFQPTETSSQLAVRQFTDYQLPTTDYRLLFFTDYQMTDNIFSEYNITFKFADLRRF